MTHSSTIAFRVDDALRAQLEAAARYEHRSLSNYVRIVLSDHVRQNPPVAPSQPEPVE